MLNIIIGIIIGNVIVGGVYELAYKKEKYATVGEKGKYKTIEEAEEAGEKKIKVLLRTNIFILRLILKE